MSFYAFIYTRERLVKEALRLLYGIWACIGEEIGGRMIGIRLNNVVGRKKDA